MNAIASTRDIGTVLEIEFYGKVEILDFVSFRDNGKPFDEYKVRMLIEGIPAEDMNTAWLPVYECTSVRYQAKREFVTPVRHRDGRGLGS